MATRIEMPKLSDTMEEGIILKWLKKEGDAVKQGEIIAEVQTDKADMELEAYDSGILRKIFVPEGSGAAVGKPIAIIAGAGEDISALLTDKRSTEAVQHHAEEKSSAPVETSLSQRSPETTVKQVSNENGGSRVKISPLAKKIAQEKNINVSTLAGSGPMGRIIKRDVEEVLSHGATAFVPRHAANVSTQQFPVSMMRKTIAKRLVESKTTAPHFYVTSEVDMKRVIEFRSALNATGEVKISYNDIIVKAAAYALRKNPNVNASWMGETITQHGEIRIGIAVALDDGLITPVIRDVDAKGLAQISAEAKDLASRAHERKLKPEEYSGGTFTVSNLGMFDVENFAAIINPPEAGILAVGSITEEPVVENGAIVIGNRMKMTLSCDHRVIDGAVGAQFMSDLKKILENPAVLAL
ncbi:MAG: pyruvate dehydrogenase complex dihydrolipoamide acetyltransferase [Bacteroidota bacterium]|nr:pyruvate dehydrogenase complex dihydrolipoamide acetyltransferase [Bacteroidota bacterium]